MTQSQQLQKRLRVATSQTVQATFTAHGFPGLRRESALTAYPLMVRGLHRTVADVLTAQRSFALSWTLPQAFDATMTALSP